MKYINLFMSLGSSLILLNISFENYSISFQKPVIANPNLAKNCFSVNNGGRTFRSINSSFEKIKTHRKKTLVSLRDSLVQKHGQTTGGWSGMINPRNRQFTHTNVGELLDDLDSNQDLSDIEKAYTWTVFACEQKLVSIKIDGNKDSFYEILPDEADPVVINDDLNGSGNTSIHTVVGLDDASHVPLIDLERSKAEDVIISREKKLLSYTTPFSFFAGNGFTNEGDINASVRQVIVLKAFAKNLDFSDLVSKWKFQFIDNGKDRYRYNEQTGFPIKKTLTQELIEAGRYNPQTGRFVDKKGNSTYIHAPAFKPIKKTLTQELIEAGRYNPQTGRFVDKKGNSTYIHAPAFKPKKLDTRKILNQYNPQTGRFVDKKGNSTYIHAPAFKP